MTRQTAETIRTFIEENFLYRSDEAALGETDSLLEAGLIDSTGILELVAFLESSFPLQMADEEIIPENLDSIAAIASYVARKTSSGGRADAA